MPMRVEAYTATGIALGIVAPDGHLREHVDGLQELRIDESDWLPIDGSAGRRVGELQVPVDDLLVLVSDELGDVPGHAQWHAIDLDAGPFRIEGELSTMPGFDPGRALARPTGQFVLLRDVRITLLKDPDAGEATSAHALVNRYTVDRIAADIMLGFFFPGAAMSMTLGGATTSGAAIPTPATAVGAVGQAASGSPGSAGSSAASPSPATPPESGSPTGTASS
jgi:hypothetical protein